MKRIILLWVLFFILSVIPIVRAQDASSTPAPSSATAVATPGSTPKHHKKKASVQATVQPTALVTPVVSSTVTVQTTLSATPVVPKKTAVQPTATAVSDTLLEDGDKAYAAKDFAKAVEDYGEFMDKHGNNPTVEKKLLLAKFYAGKALEEESRKGFKDEENYIHSDGETHNLMVYGKLHPSRDAHLVTISMALLTPQLAGGDVGLTFLAHWNVGLGIGLMGLDPRLKYYFDADNASFFLGVGYATYNYHLSSNINIGGNNGSLSGTISGNFLHFTFGPSFQDKDGFFMEIPFDVGLVNLKGSDTQNGGGGGSSGSGSYNGPFGTVGFRWGYSI
jgi:hypothetical protein